jgi:hypothetical protein
MAAAPCTRLVETLLPGGQTMRRMIGLFLGFAAVAAVAPSPATAQEAVATSEDYAVYRAALESLYRGKELAGGLPGGPVVVVRSTSPLEVDQTFRFDPPRMLMGIDSTTVAGVRALHGQRGRLVPDSLHLWMPAVGIEAATRDTLLGRGLPDWNRFDARFGAGATLLSLSRVAYNRDHTQAVVLILRSCGAMCGQGGTLLMHTQGGQWTVQRKISQTSL